MGEFNPTTPIPVRKWHLKLELHPCTLSGLEPRHPFKIDRVLVEGSVIQTDLESVLSYLTTIQACDMSKVPPGKTDVQSDLPDLSQGVPELI